MPELPDLLYIEESLRSLLPERDIHAVGVLEPLVLRVAVRGGFAEALAGRRVREVRRHGAFLIVSVPPLEMIVHFMLAGRFAVRMSPPGGTGQQGAYDRRRGKGHCFSLFLTGGLELAYLDDRRMGRVYLVQEGQTDGIPGFDAQGADLLSEDFTLEAFRELVRGRRRQVRVLLMDPSDLSAIGNAYADEILFAAGLHPKTPCHQLSDGQVAQLYRSIGTVLREGAAAVRAAGRPLEEKVRGHLKVRGRHGAPCPVCGTTIRRAGVLGYDSFFCPRCQPEAGPGLVPWQRIPGPAAEAGIPGRADGRREADPEDSQG